MKRAKRSENSRRTFDIDWGTFLDDFICLKGCAEFGNPCEICHTNNTNKNELITNETGYDEGAKELSNSNSNLKKSRGTEKKNTLKKSSN